MSVNQSDESRPSLSVEIVTTGTEILLGEIVDTNAAWIAQQLRESGINLYYKTTVGDNAERVRAIIELGLSRSDVLLVTGGLGPTKDDITRDAIADAVGAPLQLDEGALRTLEQRFERFGVAMTENNRKQVYIPRGAQLIENPVGTAPGFIVSNGQGTVIAMPGVPREMKQMMHDSILPYLRLRNGNRGIIRRRVLRTIGIGESAIDDRLGSLLEQANPTVGLAAHLGQADVRITARAETETVVEEMLDGLEETIRDRIGAHIYSVVPNEPFVDVVARMLAESGFTVAAYESNTDGDVARRLAAASSGNQSVIGAWTLERAAAASTALHEHALAAVQVRDEAFALEMAKLVRDECGATFGLALLGSTGDDEGLWSTGEGETWIALSGPSGDATLRVGYGGTESSSVVRLGNSALTLLWRALGGGQA